CRDVQGRRPIGLRRTKPVLRLCALEWPARKFYGQPETGMGVKQYIMSSAVSTVDSDGRRLTCGSGLWLVNKAGSVVPGFFMPRLGYSTAAN
uniref:Acyl-CoA dehydrogenase n=1 Tax=Mesocestoides corti TaxID=53468 RepID=A0A5K3EHJ4_MESCO